MSSNPKKKLKTQIFLTEYSYPVHQRVCTTCITSPFRVYSGIHSPFSLPSVSWFYCLRNKWFLPLHFQVLSLSVTLGLPPASPLHFARQPHLPTFVYEICLPFLYFSPCTYFVVHCDSGSATGSLIVETFLVRRATVFPLPFPWK